MPKQHGSNPTRKVSVFGPGTDVKLQYLGSELLELEGPATRKGYVIGGKINLVDVDSRDLCTGISWAPGLLEMTDSAGAKLFEVYAQEEIEAEALALPPEEPEVKPKRKEKEPDGESPVSGD